MREFSLTVVEDAALVRPAIGKIERVPLREVWPHEAHDLTRWLEENPEVLAEAIGIEIATVERERAAGAFSVDLLGEDTDGRTVVVENQLERSDHDHLGKLITYAAFFDAAANIRQSGSRVELYIDRGSGRDDENLVIFHALRAEREAIEEAFGAELDWQELPGKRACRICRSYPGGYLDKDDYDRIYTDLATAADRLRRAITPRIHAAVPR